jgi:predicted AAA+ superfamily ATPase
VFIELKRRDKEVYYYKNNKNQECDFIIKQGLNIIDAIQVCSDITDINKDREIKGLLACLDEFKLKEGKILTSDLEKEEVIDGKKIKFVPIINWLLSCDG